MSVVGSISIRDNASSVLKSIRQEQTALRKDAAETRKELQRAWDKTYTAKINTESATRKTDGLTGKVKQLGKTVISPVIKAKDAASATITKVSNGIKTVGKKVATPVIKIKDSATSKVKSIKNALTGVAKKVVVVVVQVKPRGMQEKLVSFFHFADACSQDGMDVGRKGGFVYGHRLIELEIAADGFRVEIEIIEVKSEQHVALLDVARAQNAVP